MNYDRVLDTNRLINHWYESLGSRRWRQISASQVITWAKDLIRLSGTDGILTPVRIEFLCGVHSKHQYELSSVYLDEFRVYDEGRITKADWAAAERRASRVPRDGSRRQLADCLIGAIADRLNCDVLTSDRRFPH
jgi:predicted nucleic acid-binding protein